MRHVEHFSNLSEAVAYAIPVNGIIYQHEIGEFTVVWVEQDSTDSRTLGELYATHTDYEEALNGLFIHVAHLEAVERRYESRIPFTLATIKEGR